MWGSGKKMKASGGTAGYFMLSALTCIGLASPDASKKSAKKPFKPREHVGLTSPKTNVTDGVGISPAPLHRDRIPARHSQGSQHRKSSGGRFSAGDDNPNSVLRDRSSTKSWFANIGEKLSTKKAEKDYPADAPLQAESVDPGLGDVNPEVFTPSEAVEDLSSDLASTPADPSPTHISSKIKKGMRRLRSKVQSTVRRPSSSWRMARSGLKGGAGPVDSKAAEGLTSAPPSVSSPLPPSSSSTPHPPLSPSPPSPSPPSPSPSPPPSPSFPSPISSSLPADDEDDTYPGLERDWDITGITGVEGQEPVVQDANNVQDGMPEAPGAALPPHPHPHPRPNFMMCRGRPLEVSPAYRRMCDMGIFAPETAVLPPPADPSTVQVIIPRHTPLGGIAIELPDYGLVTWDNAGDLMLKLDDPKDVSKKDLDRELCRTAQFTEFFVRHLSWARTGVDVANTRMGEFPLTPEENLDHIKGIITREAVGCGDEKWREYLSHRRVHQAFTIQDFTGDDDDLDATGDEPEAAAGVEPEAAAGVEPKAAVEQDKYVGVEAVCLKCHCKWDSGEHAGGAFKFDLGAPMLKMARFFCPVCEKKKADQGEFPLCLGCAQECLLAKTCFFGHDLGRCHRDGPRQGYENASKCDPNK